MPNYRVAVVHRGAYNASTAYVPLDEVSYNGSTYRCKANSTGNVPTNTAYWLLVSSGAVARRETVMARILATGVQGGGGVASCNLADFGSWLVLADAGGHFDGQTGLVTVPSWTNAVKMTFGSFAVGGTPSTPTSTIAFYLNCTSNAYFSAGNSSALYALSQPCFAILDWPEKAVVGSGDLTIAPIVKHTNPTSNPININAMLTAEFIQYGP